VEIPVYSLYRQLLYADFRFKRMVNFPNLGKNNFNQKSADQVKFQISEAFSYIGNCEFTAKNPRRYFGANS